MNKSKNLLVVILLLVFAAGISSCGGSDPAPETEQEKKTKQLAGTASTGKTWTITKYVAGSETVTSNIGTKIVFNPNGSFSIVEPEDLPNTRTPLDVVLPSAGQWSFENATTLNSIKLTPTTGGNDNAVTLSNVIVNETSLTFDYAGILLKPAETPQITVQVTAVSQ